MVCVNFSHQQDPENGHACSVLGTQKTPSQSHSRKQSQQASLLPPHHLTYNSNDIKQFLTKGPCHRLGVVLLLLPFINRADEAIRQTTAVSVSPAAWENYFVLS